MKTFNNEIVIHCGESFTIDKLLVNKDGSPYVISSQLTNPYFLLTISDSKYDQSNRYVANYWLDLKNFPRFGSTHIVDLSSIKRAANSNEPVYREFPTEPTTGEDGTTYYLGGYVDGEYVMYNSPSDAVFSNALPDGSKVYKYIDKDLAEDGSIRWLTYSCRLVKAFSVADTSKLVGQNYVYSIRLVSGTPSENNNPPLEYVDVSVPMLPATKLVVLSNVGGDL